MVVGKVVIKILQGSAVT